MTNESNGAALPEAELLRQLVTFQTVTDNIATNNEALDFITGYLAERGMHVVRHTYNGAGALIATTRETKTPAVMFIAHTDVVPAPEKLFTMNEKDGKFFGRGVWDMKFAIASYMTLVDELRDELDAYDFGIMLSSDEEAKDDGVRAMVEEGFLPRVAILPDGANDWQIETAAKGAYYFIVHFTGKTAHGSRPWLGDSVSFKIHRFMSGLTELFEGQGPKTPTLNVSSPSTFGIITSQTNFPRLLQLGGRITF